MYDPTDTVALITGSKHGIGLALARQFLGAGARVVLNGRSQTAEADALLAGNDSDRVILAYADVADFQVVAGLVANAAVRADQAASLLQTQLPLARTAPEWTRVC